MDRRKDVEEKGNKFLPIGTVVLLKGGVKKLMITGFMAKPTEAKSKTYDYCGCLYPEGIITTDNTFLFNHDNIESILYRGYVDKEEEVFKEKLNILIKNDKEQKEKSDNTEIIS